jgi:hypothetical protein
MMRTVDWKAVEMAPAGGRVEGRDGGTEGSCDGTSVGLANGSLDGLSDGDNDGMEDARGDKITAMYQMVDAVLVSASPRIQSAELLFSNRSKLVAFSMDTTSTSIPAFPRNISTRPIRFLYAPVNALFDAFVDASGNTMLL